MEIQIHHISSQDGINMFEVIRSWDMKRTAPVSLPEPATFPVEGHSVKKFLPELRWYLEDYLQAPFGAFPELAESVVETMQAWGATIFDALFTGHARDWYQEAKRQNFQDFRIKITSDSPEIMSWPWEALCSQDDGYLALRCCIDRQLSDIGDPPTLSATINQDSIHILYILSRPYDNDNVSYHILANSLVDYIRENSLPVTVDILRPPTFDRLREVLYEHPGYYHIVHFDGHGGYSTVTSTPTGNVYSAPEGQLVFETDNGKPDPVDTGKLAQLLARYNIPFIVMNACRSGMIDGQAKDPFASVAAGLLKAGVRSVVAMGYSLYESGAKKFVPAFYERLFSTGKVSEAMLAGREKMLERPERNCVVGQLPLQDWVVPVLYQQLPAESSILPKIQPEREPEDTSILPESARVDGDYGFIGRGRDIQKLERAIQRQPQAAILIHGQAGIGKTTLAKGFLSWLENTGGLHNCVFWFDFRDIRSAEYIMNRLLDELVGTSSVATPLEEKLKMLVQRLRKKPYLVIWDNFESASGIEETEIQPNLSTEDRKTLAQLLKDLRGGKTRVLITSRNKETWLPVQSCYRLSLDGLTGEDLWEYCNAVVRDLGLTLDRNNESYAKSLKKLWGNPLAIRAILLRLQDCTVEQLLTELENSFEGMEGDESTRRLQAAYAVFCNNLIERFLPILQLTGLHEHYAYTDFIKEMLNEAGFSVEPTAVDSCYHILENAGFCTHMGQDIYRLHPVLRGYLQQRTPAPISVQERFVDIMGSLAYVCLGKQQHEIGFLFQNNTVNFYYARQLAEARKMDTHYMGLTEALALYAVRTRCFKEASNLYAAYAEKAQLLDCYSLLAGAFHQLGIIAQEQRDFMTAETYYKKSLAINEEQGDEYAVALTYHQLCALTLEQRNLEAAEAWCIRALTIEKKRKNKYGIASTYQQLGDIALARQDFATAEAWYEKALAIEQKHEDETDVAITYQHLGVLAEKKRDFITAIAWYQKALAINEKYGNEHDVAITHQRMGNIAEENHYYAVAEALYKEALAIMKKLMDGHGIAIAYYMLGGIAEKQQDFAAAEIWYKDALEISEKQNDARTVAIIYCRLGSIAGKQRGFEVAEAWCKKALAINQAQDDEENASITPPSFSCSSA